MGRRIFTSIVLVCLALSLCQAQTDKRKAFIRKYRNIAIEEMDRTGIPASITLAQGILESADGTSELARMAKNFFGIKCHDWQGATYIMDDDKKNECFRKYRYAEESWVDHSDFLVSRSHYAPLFKLSKTDYKGWAKGLKKAGYATDPNYAQRLIQIIEDEQLYIYDKPGKRYSRIVGEVTSSIQDYGDNAYSEQVIYVNKIPCVKTKSGDTFEAIAAACGIPLKRLLRYNDKNETSIRPGMHVFLSNKKNKAARGYRFHKVKAGETMYWIAQMYGIKFYKLLQYNYMTVEDIPQPGELISLRGAAKLF